MSGIIGSKLNIRGSGRIAKLGTDGQVLTSAGAAETFDLYIDDGDGGTDHYIYKDQAIGAKETFEHTSRIVLEGTDMLGIIASAGDLDVVVSYLDQTL